MSEYLSNFDFDALIGPDDQALDLSFLDNSNPIGQNETAGYDYNATYDFDPNMDLSVDPACNFDFNASFQPGPPLPVLPNATTTTDQSLLNLTNEIIKGGHSTLLDRYHQSIKSSEGSTRIDNFTCQVCYRSFNQEWELDHHCMWRNHATWGCTHSGCGNRFHVRQDRNDHQRTPHSSGHREVWDDSAIFCAECNEILQKRQELEEHARNQKHSPYACFCGVKFARRDVLARHLKGFTKESAKYQCTFCKRHRGKQAFRRRDHLVQHLRGYHKMEAEEIDQVSPSESRARSRRILICPHEECEAYRDDAFRALPWTKQYEGRPFQKQSDFNKHMRDVHRESAFPCHVTGCDRVGIKGYMREKDLMKHLVDKHPEAPTYSYVPPPSVKYQCEVCGANRWTASSFDYHQTTSKTCRNLRKEPQNAYYYIYE